MIRVRQGDTVAYRRLLDEVGPYLRRLASRYHRDACDVEDAVQDILLTVHAVRLSFDPARSFGPWLVGIARRRAVDRLRLQVRRRRYELALRAEHEAIPDLSADYESGFGRRCLLGAVDTLPPAQRRAIRLLKLEEKSLKEAAVESRMSVAALKVATHRAMHSLRGRLADRIDHR